MSENGNTGKTLGIISLVAWLLPIVGIPVAIVGIVKSNGGRSPGGLAMSIIGLVLAVINAAVGAIMAVA